MTQLLILFLWLAACALQDLYQRQIANTLTLGGMALAVLYLLGSGHTWLGAPPSEALVALLIALVLTLPGYALNKFGAGDVKLLVTLALATDRLTVLGTFIGAGLCAALWLLIASKILPLVYQRVTTPAPGDPGPLSKKVPFAPFLLAGFALATLCMP
ncbi:prepilin peptidase [Pseudomonas lundensis]|uniref:prepilin peptidase n=1 Tax=Pseudomonas lundensis TaxID=86185 RepID=UPI00089DBA8B|nr:prepilin peptidase [Pseudomonas lundensis]